MILGCDGAGVLDDGTAVVIYPIVGDPDFSGDETLDPRRTLLTEKEQGTFAEYVTVPARNVAPPARCDDLRAGRDAWHQLPHGVPDDLRAIGIAGR